MKNLTPLVALLQAALAAAGNYQWEVVNENAVSAKHLDDPGVWLMGQTDTFEDCQTACAANNTCNACDWAGNVDAFHHGSCPYKLDCYFRADQIWAPAENGHCNHTAARKVPAPAPIPPPNPPLGFQPNIVFFLEDDQDLSIAHRHP